ncbi:hypothetical protein BpHYR1_017691 [Brachionus plicatilis]|uniref:Uncharacterized protein n=1 Tax=Brachionus plicatilis TaxID=10195 RepID=A0A3M7S932_BRAPC|nr:hypothetical protein BpHYR1_017691 [Brachionus plicatilis]
MTHRTPNSFVELKFILVKQYIKLFCASDKKVNLDNEFKFSLVKQYIKLFCASDKKIERLRLFDDEKAKSVNQLSNICAEQIENC